jgi:hypothetical protein
MATVEEAVNGVKQEAGEILEAVQSLLSDLNFDTSSLDALIEKYNLLSREVLGVGYDGLVLDKALPPVDPSALYDQVRLGLVSITALGDIFFPTVTSGGNLKSTQEFYTSVGNNLSLVASQLSANPPGNSSDDTFTNASSRFTVRSIASRTSKGVLKTREEVSEELGVGSFDLFTFSDLPQLAFVVIPEFLSINEPMSSISRRLDLPTPQIVNRVNWFGSVNASTNNFSKMRVTLGLSNPQIRSASFGDDMAVASSNLFKILLEDMVSRFNFVTSSLPSNDKILSILDAVQQDAFEFLAQLSFGTTTLGDPNTLDDSREAGVRDSDLEFSFQNRDDPNFSAADLEANALLTTVFPSSSNAKDRQTLGRALQQDPDTPRYTNKALNSPVDRRENVVLASKNLVAGLTARTIVIGQESADRATVANALEGVLADITSLSTAYEEFLNPPEADARQIGTRTTESANITLTRATNLVRTLRILDQIANFPADFSGEVSSDLQSVLNSLGVIATAIETYLNIYRNGEVRDFLASAVSVSSVTNLLLADGEPSSSLIVQEVPAAIDNLRSAIQSLLLDDPDCPNLYRGVSLQVGAFAAALRGTSDDDPVGRLFSLPVTVLDALLPSEMAPNAFSITLEGDQEPALRQIRESFDVLGQTTQATIRDLGIMVSNFGCAFTDAEFFVARLAGDSVGELVTALRQS